MPRYNMVAQTSESTVVAEYTPETSKSDAYQSEVALEKEFIRLLEEQGYDFLPIHSESDLIVNLREQLERLNDYHFSAEEWDRFFHENIANKNEGIVEKTRKIQEDYVQVLKKDDGTSQNITLIDKKNIHNNRTQVINQYVNNAGAHDNRYDVTILVNGLPMVHVELKRRGVALKEAFNQIERYQRDSFWAGYGLYEYIQIFVISNGTYTKYYSNTTRFSHIEQNRNGGKGKKTSNSFEFTSYWADGANHTIPDLVDFAKTFFARHTILAILTKYCVFTTEELLLVMRPYQIAATERILNRIEIATNYKKMGTTDAGGFIWHTTGSGKTLTSFKTAQMASKMESIDKVLFVVDRKDLDYQTMKEYDRFEKGCANGNSSTTVLQRQLENRDVKGNPHNYPILVTTIQKLGNFVSRNKTHPVYNRHIVIIFDECHRSQFGDMHHKIVHAFKNYHIFGFTGTPIFAENAHKGKHLKLLTTPQTFGDCLHTYTIVDAINDGNVLPFRIDYINTVKEKEQIRDKQVAAIDIEKAMLAPKRISEVVHYVLEHFDQKTKRNSSYSLKGKRVNGFNSIFACASIPAAKLYYTEFKKQIKAENSDLIIATIYSYGANEADPEEQVGGFLSEEEFETDGLDQPSRDFLESCIKDYNATFSTNFDTSGDKFQNYYKDLSQRVKNREVDILIVVNMFLTGFDATTLNTLWVDKNLKQHGLIQAFSRTNRILNSVKTFGNIVCFRNLQKQVDEAVALFGDKDAGGIILLKNFEAYYYGFDENGKHYDGYVELIDKLKDMCPPGSLPYGEDQEKEFIKLFSGILSCRNILSTFDQFDPNEAITEREMQNYQSIYLELYEKYRKRRPEADKENINDDIVFEIDLIKQVDINIDYILALVAKMHAEQCEDKEILAAVLKVAGSSLFLRSKKALIEQFILSVNIDKNLAGSWTDFVVNEAAKDFDQIIQEEKLKAEEATAFMEKAFKEGAVKETGTDLVAILPPTGRFGAYSMAIVKQRVLNRLKEFFDKYFGLGIFENKEFDEEKLFIVEDTGVDESTEK